MKESPVHVVLIEFEIYLPYSHSLKEKRMCLRGIKDRLAKLNVAIAEVGYQDSWQRSRIACTSVSNEKRLLLQLKSQIENLLQENLDGELISCDLEWL